MSLVQRKALVGVAPQAWEHPADLAALRALRAVPGFDEVLKRLVGSLGERGVRLLFQASEDYARILRGEHPRRGELAPAEPVAEAAAHYARSTQTIATELASSAKQAAGEARDFVQSVGSRLRKDR